MSGPALVVMAAGIGSRYGGLKQVDPIGPNGEIIIDYSIYDALKAGFEKVVFIVNRDIEKAFRARVGKTIEKRCDTAYVFQELGDVPEGFEVPQGRHKPWGTAHATLSCKNVVDSPFAAINADDFYGRASFQALCDYLKKAQDHGGVCDYCMVGFVLENTLTEHGHVSRGICVVDGDGFLVEVRERTHIERSGEAVAYTEDGETWVEIPRGSVVSMNMWGFTPGVFSELEGRFPHFLEKRRDDIQRAEYLLPDVVNDLLEEKRATVKVLPTEERWFGVTYREDMPGVRKALRDLLHRGVYPDNLWG